MNVFCIIIGIILIVLAVCIGIVAGSYADSIKESLFLYIIGVIVAIGGVFLIKYTINGNNNPFKPQAIDVYKGKTQMVLNYNNDGTYDSIVVWKGGAR